MFGDSNLMGLMGASILANNGNVGRGLLDAYRARNMYQANQWQNQLAKLKVQQARAKQQAEQARAALERQGQQRLMQAVQAQRRDPAYLQEIALGIPSLQQTAMQAMMKSGKSYAPVKVMKNGVPTWVSREEAFGQPAAVSNGMQLTTNPDGTVSFSQGGYGGLNTKPTENKLQEKQFNVEEQLARLKAMDDAFQPEFQQYSGRFGLTWDAIKESMGGELDSDEKAALSNFSIHKRRGIENLNLVIKEMTGTAINKDEVPRIKASIPSAGTGIFDGDSPTEYQAKLDDTKQSLLNALRRIKYARANGLDWKTIPLDNMNGIIQQRGEALANAYLQQGLSEEQANQKALADLKQEFGL